MFNFRELFIKDIPWYYTIGSKTIHNMSERGSNFISQQSIERNLGIISKLFLSGSPVHTWGLVFDIFTIHMYFLYFAVSGGEVSEVSWSKGFWARSSNGHAIPWLNSRNQTGHTSSCNTGKKCRWLLLESFFFFIFMLKVLAKPRVPPFSHLNLFICPSQFPVDFPKNS